MNQLQRMRMRNAHKSAITKRHKSTATENTHTHTHRAMTSALDEVGAHAHAAAPMVTDESAAGRSSHQSIDLNRSDEEKPPLISTIGVLTDSPILSGSSLDSSDDADDMNMVSSSSFVPFLPRWSPPSPLTTKTTMKKSSLKRRCEKLKEECKVKGCQCWIGRGRNSTTIETTATATAAPAVASSGQVNQVASELVIEPFPDTHPSSSSSSPSPPSRLRWRSSGVGLVDGAIFHLPSFDLNDSTAAAASIDSPPTSPLWPSPFNFNKRQRIEKKNEWNKEKEAFEMEIAAGGGGGIGDASKSEEERQIDQNLRQAAINAAAMTPRSQPQIETCVNMR